MKYLFPQFTDFIFSNRNYPFSQYNIMKTSESFFPTRTHIKQRQIHNDNTYQLIKKQEPCENQLKEGYSSALNIFREARLEGDKDNKNYRPVGGTQLFRKMQLQQRQRSRHSKRSNKESQRNISSNFANKRKDRDQEQRENFADPSPAKVIKQIYNSAIRPSMKQQNYKSHMSYMPQSKILKSHTQPMSSKQSSTMARPATSNTYKKSTKDAWAQGQRIAYQDKIALLNEINYNKPLVEVYGERYFQFMLRNRYEEDLKPPAYIYQIGKKFSESRAINSIKRYRPDIHEKEMIVIRGKKMSCGEVDDV